jgi:UDP-N-acetylmuramate dehydrogenase
MKICKNISLKSYNTFGIDCVARCLVHVRTDKEVAALFRGDISWQGPLLIIGGGSNILFTDDFMGTILHPQFSGIRIEKQQGDDVIISAGAGINWDKLVEWAVAKAFGGIENLSHIPGNVGAAAVQNIGAYGVEAKDTIVKVKTITVANGSVKFFSNEECSFSYRNSIFKDKEKGRYLVTKTWFRLKSNPMMNLDYGSLKDEVKKLGSPTLKNVRQAVINIRRSKLPDPEATGNAGSFFKNPVVSSIIAEKLIKKFPEMPSYTDLSGGVKLAAGWLIEQCGWKGTRLGDAGVHDKQALVLVNHGNASGREIYDLSEKIRISVLEKYGINLDREVEIIGST